MKRLSVLALLATVAVFVATAESQAHGLFRRGSGCGGCAAPCATPCAAPCAPVAPTPPKYEERKITVCKPVMVTKEVEVLVCKPVMKQEQYSYVVCTPVMKQEKRLQTICTPTYKEVDRVFTVMVPKCVQKEVMVTNWKCETVMVKECVPVRHIVCVPCVDACGRCFTQRQCVTTMEERTRCVVKRTPVMEKRMVNVVVCEPRTQTCKVRVCEIVRSQCEVMVNVCTIQRETKVGTRQVCSYVTEKVKQKVQVCEMQKFEQTIKVMVCPPCPTTSCASPACGTCGRARHGLFRRGSCCY